MTLHACRAECSSQCHKITSCHHEFAPPDDVIALRETTTCAQDVPNQKNKPEPADFYAPDDNPSCLTNPVRKPVLQIRALADKRAWRESHERFKEFGGEKQARKFGWEAGIRTPIGRSIVCSPTARRPSTSFGWFLANQNAAASPSRPLRTTGKRTATPPWRSQQPSQFPRIHRQRECCLRTVPTTPPAC